MRCPNCEIELKITEDKIIVNFLVCEKCGYKTIEYPISGCCLYPNNKPFIFYIDGIDLIKYPDPYVIFKQCQSCGKKNGPRLRRSDYKKEVLEYFNRVLEAKRVVLKQEVMAYLKRIEEIN